MPGVAELTDLPASWEQMDGVAYCLGCLRKLAGEARAAALTDGESSADRVRANAEGRIEFELKRNPDRCDTRVARATGTNVMLVRRVRERLGAYPIRPV
jgi:predicted Fe-S protein YdhL (DUF1289 family)